MNSYWENDRENYKKYKSLNENMQTEICVIGGGITGLSIAYYLSQNAHITVLEKDRICNRTSAKNTGKITSQHGLFYDYLINSQNKEFAKKYLEANQNAIDKIENIVNLENIDCDFKRENAYVFTNNIKELEKIKKEVNSIKQFNNEICNYCNKIDLPLSCKGAIEFKNQAKFNPLKYCYGLAEAINKYGGNIFENSQVENVTKEADKYIIDVNGKKVISKIVILATRYPILNFPGYYFLKMYQSTSYAMVFDCKQNLFDGMYINAEVPSISFRTIEEKNKKLLLAVGYDYKTGKPSENGYNELVRIVKSMYPNAVILSKWTAEDCISLDKIPYIGEYSNIMKNLYVATGFNKWGITTSNIAAQIIADKILDKANKYEDIFKSTRLKPIKNKEELSNMIEEANKSIVLSRLTNTKVQPTCTHLGCKLYFNQIEDIWECPCHGSKFTCDGKSIEAPSNKDLNIE